MTTQLFAYITLPHLYTHLAQRQIPGAQARPLAVASAATERAVLIDVCARAAANGVRTGMTPAEARARCGSLRIIAAQEIATEPYERVIEQVLLQHTNDVEQQGGTAWVAELVALGVGFRYALRAARLLQRDIAQRIKLPCMIGVASNTLIAKIAAQIATDEPVLVQPGSEGDFLAPLPVCLLPGVGAQTEVALARLGIKEIGQLARLTEGDVRQLLGPRGTLLRLRAQGHAVALDRASASGIAGRWTVSGEPPSSASAFHAETRLLTERVGRRLRAQQCGAGALTVRLTWLDGRQSQQSVRIVPRRDLDCDLCTGSEQILRMLLAQRRLAVTTIEVQLSDLGNLQPDLFTPDTTRSRDRQHAIDAIKERHGTRALVVARLVDYLRRAA